MKKLFALTLAIAMLLMVTACGLASVEAYVDANRDELVETFESSFSSSGFTCKTDVKADGNKMIFDVRIDGIDNLTDDQKALLQDTYDSMQTTFDSSFEEMQSGLPALEAVTWNICEEDGDIAAVIKAGNQ